MKNILVPVDFSPASRHASVYAGFLAKKFNTGVHLLHVYKDPAPVTMERLPYSVTVSKTHEKKQALINTEIEYLQTKYGIKVKGEVITGFTADTINNSANELDAGLIMMGMAAGKNYSMLGSVALKMIRKSDRPLLIIPETASVQEFKNISLAVDFKEMVHSSTLGILFEIVKKSDGVLHVWHVEKPGSDVKASELPEKLQLEKTLSKVTFWYDHVENDDVNQGILNFVESHPTDLLVMIAHQHNLFEKIFGGLHTSPITLDIKIPLLVLKNE